MGLDRMMCASAQFQSFLHGSELCSARGCRIEGASDGSSMWCRNQRRERSLQAEALQTPEKETQGVT